MRLMPYFKKFIFLVLPALILLSPVISRAESIVQGELANSYSADETTQLRSAWVAAGKNPDDFQWAVNYASLSRMTVDEFMTGATNNDPSWTPFTQLQALQAAWRDLGYNPGDLAAAIQGADPGLTSAEILAGLQQQAVDLAKQYQDFQDEMKKYEDLYNQAALAMANGDPIDWDEIARQLGMEPSTPDDIWARLQDLNYYVGAQNDEERQRQQHGLSPAAYMNYLLGKSSFVNNTYCMVGAISCHTQTRNKLDEIISQPGKGRNGGGEIEQPLVSDNQSNTFLDNLRQQLPSLVRLVFALSYTIGVVFCIIGVLKLKHIGESRGSSASQTGGLISVMAYMITGSALIYLPSSLNVTTGTFFLLGGDSSLFAYSDNAIAGMTYDNLVAVLIDIVKLVGLIAFVRGWIMLSKIGGQSQHGTMGKSIVHIVAGILAVNIVTTWEVARATFGYAW